MIRSHVDKNGNQYAYCNWGEKYFIEVTEKNERGFKKEYFPCNCKKCYDRDLRERRDRVAYDDNNRRIFLMIATPEMIFRKD